MMPRWDLFPRNCVAFGGENGEVSKQAWECALLTAVRDEIRAGNILSNAANGSAVLTISSLLMQSGKNSGRAFSLAPVCQQS